MARLIGGSRGLTADPVDRTPGTADFLAQGLARGIAPTINRYGKNQLDKHLPTVATQEARALEQQRQDLQIVKQATEAVRDEMGLTPEALAGMDPEQKRQITQRIFQRAGEMKRMVTQPGGIGAVPQQGPPPAGAPPQNQTAAVLADEPKGPGIVDRVKTAATGLMDFLAEMKPEKKAEAATAPQQRVGSLLGPNDTQAAKRKPAAPQQMLDGTEAQNPETGQVIVLRGGRWVDKETGEPVQ